ncbi:MAG: sigma-70 family RNA polymerase sigma factor [Bacteroidetes bacterium]|nr:sigma-70 family RNA polymerase sigma factor [Bacteroidota bacterium]
MTAEEIIQGCLVHDRNCQRMLYEQYFGKMLNVSIRYAKNLNEAKEILHHAFKSIFSKLKQFMDLNAKRKNDVPAISLEEWIKKLMIEAAIEHMHNNKRGHLVSSTVNARETEKTSSAEITDDQIIAAADTDAILQAVQQLSASYRLVYNMHEVDGYPHAEISKLLDISESTSRDNFSKAKFNIRTNLARRFSK